MVLPGPASSSSSPSWTINLSDSIDFLSCGSEQGAVRDTEPDSLAPLSLSSLWEARGLQGHGGDAALGPGAAFPPSSDCVVRDQPGTLRIRPTCKALPHSASLEEGAGFGGQC